MSSSAVIGMVVAADASSAARNARAWQPPFRFTCA
jgi:hypothetical protein